MIFSIIYFFLNYGKIGCQSLHLFNGTPEAPKILFINFCETNFCVIVFRIGKSFYNNFAKCTCN